MNCIVNSLNKLKVFLKLYFSWERIKHQRDNLIIDLRIRKYNLINFEAAIASH